MVSKPERPDPKAIELDARALWVRENLPPPSGLLGPGEGPVVHQFEGSFAPQEAGMLVVQRAVAADVDARALSLGGRRAVGTLRREATGPPTAEHRLEELLTALGVWVGGRSGQTVTADPPTDGVQTVVGRLAHLGALAVRDVALRVCPACAVARDPERIVYREESGATLLVRFPFTAGDQTVSALVWTDSAWRLLGSSALLLHPELPYVIARYRRGGDEELVLTSRSSLVRIRDWLRGAELEVLEEHPGKHWEGTPYVHPLRNEFPLGGGLEPPAGTILTIGEVTDTGTGIVPLVPGHGGTDAVIAERLGVPGWPLLTPKGRFDIMLVHKYAGLELQSGDDFVGRDLAESGAIFARLRVRRGVPHCARCGSRLIWAPGRAWCLEPSRLPAASLAVYRTALPRDRPIERLEAVPWPVSEPLKSEEAGSIALLECTSCDRLEAPTAPGDRCPCGGRRRSVRRRLLSAFEGAAAEWTTVDPFPRADAVRIYVNDRRRAPAVVHHLAALSGVAGTVGEVRVTVLPTVPEADFAALLTEHGADAVRAALVREQASEGRTATFEERCRQERGLLDRFLAASREVLAHIDAPERPTFAQPVASFLGELEPEDRAVLARFERMRIQAIADFERGAAGAALRRIGRFLDNELATYRQWARPRIDATPSSPTRRAALRTVAHILLQSALLIAPVAPHTAEAVHGALAPRRVSVFEESVPGVERTLLDDERAKAWDRWTSVLRAVARARRALGLPAGTAIPRLVLVVGSDPTADAYHAEAAIVERLAKVTRLEVASPAHPWAGRRRQLRPVESEIQRVYSSRAAQIIHLLRRTTERKVVDPGQGFALMVNGQPTQILPSMIDWVETLPERTVPSPWRDGEMYLELPVGPGGVAPPPPPLSVDAFRLVERVRHRIRETRPDPSAVAVVLVVASGGLGAELTSVAPGIATHLGLKEFRVVPTERDLPPGRWERGREHSGAPWAFHLSGAPRGVPPVKQRPVRVRGDRLRPAFSPASIAPSVLNYSEDEYVARHAAVRSLGEQMDELLGRPLLGPSKMDAAWDAGLRSVDDFRKADWQTLVDLPGFGEPIAATLVEKLGGIVPPRPVRPRRVPGNGASAGSSASLSTTPSRSTGGTASSPASPVAVTGSTATERTAPPLPFSTLGVPEPAPEVPSAEEPATTPIAVPRSPGPGATATAESGPVDPSPGPSPPPEIPEPAAEFGSGPPEVTLPEPREPAAAPRVSDAVLAPTPAEDRPVERSEVPIRDVEPPQPVSRDETALDAPPDEGAPAVAAPSGSGDGEAELPPRSASGDLVPATESAPNLASPGPTSPDEPPGLEPSPAAPSVKTSPEPEPDLREMPTVDAAASSSETGPEAESTRAEASSLVVDFAPEPVADNPAERAPETGTTSDDRELTPEPASLTTEKNPEPPSQPPNVPESDSIESASSLAAPLARDDSVGSTPAPATPAADDLSLHPPALVTPAPAEVAASPIPVPMAAPPAEPTPPPSPRGGIELDVGPSYLPALERFLDATSAGHLGICVVRDSPERVRAYAGSRPVEIRWLTNIGRGATLKPTDLEGFSGFLAHALANGRATVFFLEGVEYLVRLHGLDRVVAELVRFGEEARARSARVWVSLNPKLLSPAELEAFLAALRPAV
jgi:hypothetical protein